MTWLRVPHHFARLIVIILKSLLDISYDKTNDSEYAETGLKVLHECLTVLKELVPSEMQKLRNDILSAESLSPGYKEIFLYL